MLRVAFWVGAFAALLGCGPNEAPDTSDSARETVVYPPVVGMKQFMVWVLDPAADAIWESAGFVMTAQGERSLAPTTKPGWLRVEKGAVLVAESGNLLRLPGRAAGPDWIESAKALVDAGREALLAAQKRDADALFDAGGEVYQACRSCHDRYMEKSGGARNGP